MFILPASLFPRSADAAVTVRTVHQRPPRRVNVFVFALSCPSVFALEVDEAPLATKKKSFLTEKVGLSVLLMDHPKFFFLRGDIY